MNSAASQSVACGTSPTMAVDVAMPTTGTAITENALACAGSARARPNQMICA